MTTRNVIGCCRKENKLYHQVVQLVPCLAIKTVCIFDSLTSSRLFSVTVFDRHVYRVSTDVSTDSVHRVLVDTYLVTKLHRRCRLTTDTPPIRYWTDGSPIYCRHTTDTIATDRRSICRRLNDDRSMIRRPYRDRHTPNTRPTLPIGHRSLPIFMTHAIVVRLYIA